MDANYLGRAKPIMHFWHYGPLIYDLNLIALVSCGISIYFSVNAFQNWNSENVGHLFSRFVMGTPD